MQANASESSIPSISRSGSHNTQIHAMSDGVNLDWGSQQAEEASSERRHTSVEKAARVVIQSRVDAPFDPS